MIKLLIWINYLILLTLYLLMPISCIMGRFDLVLIELVSFVLVFLNWNRLINKV